jgi:hypothetical protein
MASTPEHPVEVVLGPEDQSPWLILKWQHGPIRENGENGMQADEVIETVLDYLRALNVPPFNRRETSLAITDLESAQNWLRRRTLDRLTRGVEGTNTP